MPFQQYGLNRNGYVSDTVKEYCFGFDVFWPCHFSASILALNVSFLIETAEIMKPNYHCKPLIGCSSTALLAVSAYICLAEFIAMWPKNIQCRQHFFQVIERLNGTEQLIPSICKACAELIKTTFQSFTDNLRYIFNTIPNFPAHILIVPMKPL